MRSSMILLSVAATSVMGVAVDHAKNFDRDTMPQGYEQNDAYPVSQIEDGKLSPPDTTPF